MNYEVTRDVIKDLWPLYQSNELSQEARSMIEEFLSHDREFASLLRESRLVSPVTPKNLRLSPDQERRLLDEARERARWKLLIVGGSIGLAGLVLIVALIAVIALMFTRSA